MTNRREFLAYLSAAASSFALAGVPRTAQAGWPFGAPRAMSPSGTTVPPADEIVDHNGHVWTLSKGYIYEDGVRNAQAYDADLLLGYQGALYHRNVGGDFYAWTGSTWMACLDPRLGGTSPDGATMPPAAYLIDKAGNQWGLSRGYIYKNGIKDPDSYNVSLLLWYGGMIYQRGTNGQFYVYGWDHRWRPCSDPRRPLAADAGAFYGVNGHYDYPFTPAQTVAALGALGCSIYRLGCVDTSEQMQPVIAMAKAFQQAGLTLFVLLNYGLKDSNGAYYTSESAAYQACRQGAAAVARALQPYGVTMYECGNELTRDEVIVAGKDHAGTKVDNFLNEHWPIMRGAMRGMIDGVKSVQPSAKAGINFCVADVAAADMLWDGMQPDGSGGHPKVRWDLTTWHNYEPYGDIFNIGTDGAGPGFNLPAYCKARYGKPFLLTEWNAAPERSEDYRGKYVSAQLAEFYAARKTHGLQSAMYYQLTSGDKTYGIVTDQLEPLQPTYGDFRAFVAANPDR